MTARLRRSIAAGCVALALAICGFVAYPNWQVGTFTDHENLPVKPMRRVSSVTAALPTGTVDVNHADVATLCGLQGIGPKLADAIVIEREKNGLFYFPEDLLMVPGIGIKTLAKFYHQLDFSGVADKVSP